MFNLEQAIKDWRRQLQAAGVTSTETLDELESHLCDEIERQISSGQSEADAFRLAVQQLGHASALQAEFAKPVEAKPATRRRALMKLGSVFAGVFALIGTVYVAVSPYATIEKLVGFCLIGGMALYLGSLPLSFAAMPALFNQRWRLVIQATGTLVWLICGALILDFILPLLDMDNFGTNHHFLMTVFWAMMPVAVVLTWLVNWATETGQSPLPGTGGWFRPTPPLLIPPSVPPAETFTPRARQALEDARKEAAHLHHNFIGTEHVLLGLLASEDGMVTRVLRRLGVEVEAVKNEITRLVAIGPVAPSAPVAPFTPRALKAFKLAAREAATLKHPRVGTEHVLLGLLREGSGVAALVLRNLKLDLNIIREQVRREVASCPDHTGW